MRTTANDLYRVRDMGLPEGTQNFFGYINHVNLRHVALSFGSYNIPVQVFHEGIESVPPAILRQRQRNNDGRIVYHRGDARQSCVTPALTPVTFNFGPTFEHLVLRIPQTMLERKLAAILGTYAHPGAGVRTRR